MPAEPLIEEFLDTRIPEERPHYELLVEWTEHLARRALSNEVITPGVTTIGDIRRWLYDRSHEAGFVLWFQPDLRVQRRAAAPANGRRALADAPGVGPDRGPAAGALDGRRHGPSVALLVRKCAPLLGLPPKAQ